MACVPASHICCGFSVYIGVVGVLACHFALCLAIIAQTCLTVFYPSPGWLLPSDVGLQVAAVAFSLAGLPFIVAAGWGVLKKQEALVRVYLAYLVLTVFIDMTFVVKEFVLSGPCEGLPKLLVDQGRAWACGMARIVNSCIVVAATTVQLYLIYAVWSFCEDLASGGGPDLSDLVLGEDALVKMRRKHDPYEAIVCGEYAPGGYGSVYEAAAAGVGGSSPIFDGRFHELQYPPPAGSARS